MGVRQGALETVVKPMPGALPSPAFWRDKRVLVTGHTGFKGGWLALWLQRLGARVSGIALEPSTTPSLHDALSLPRRIDGHFIDIRDAQALRQRVHALRPDLVLHLAAQPLVRQSYADPLATWSSNVMGTAHLLDALRGLDSVRAAVMVTTDKVYRNLEWVHPYREGDALGGHDPYSASKAACELVIGSYRDAFLREQGVAIASARAGNVIGGGDWSADRLIPDAVRAWQGGQPLRIRYPDAVRPWQHVLEPLAGYLVLAQRLWESPALAGAYNFGPPADDIATVREVVTLARDGLGRGEVEFGAPTDGLHEAGRLALDPSKAAFALGVRQLWALGEAITRTMAWYRDFHAGAEALALCERDIAAYEAGRKGAA